MSHQPFLPCRRPAPPARTCLVPLLALCLLAVAAGCAWTVRTASSSSAAAASGFIPGVLRQPLTVEPTTFDPGVVIDNETYDVIQQIYEGLTGIDENNRVVPLLAEAMPAVSPDGKVYTFRIRKGARFTNGRPVTAGDVKYSMTRMLTPALASPTAMLELDDIVGARELNTGKAKDLIGVTVPDDRTVRIQLVGPRPYFPGKLATVYVVAQEEVEKGPRNEAGAHLIDATNSVGTGPFKLSEYTRQQRLTLVVNAEYWGGKPPLARIERPIVLDWKTTRSLYDTGQLDLIRVTTADYAEARKDPNMKGQVRLSDRALLTYVGLSQKRYAPFRDRRVRQALALATDRAALAESVLYGVGVTAEGVLPPGIPGYAPTFKGMPHDVDRARRLLTEAGYTKERPLPPFTLLYVEKVPLVSLIVQVLREQWAAAGITVNLQETEGGTLIKAMERKDYDATIASWSPNYPDPQGIVSVQLLPGAAGNFTGYSSPAFNALCRAADTAPDQASRYALYQKAMRKAINDAPVIPLYFRGDTELVSPLVHGLRESLIWRLPHTRTSVR